MRYFSLLWVKYQTWLVIILGVALLSVGLAIVWLTTPLGMGLGNDAVAYIAGARSLLDGGGYRRIWLYDREPITHFPPLFSLLLAGVSWVAGTDPLVTARGVVAVLYALNGLLVGTIVWQISRSRAGLLLGMALFFANPSLLEVHRYAMSEPLYLALSLISILTLARFFQHKQDRWLALTGLLISLAFLTRYVGLAVLASAWVALLLCLPGWRGALRSLLILSCSSFPLSAAWLLRNTWVAGSAANRQLIWHPVSLEKIMQGVDGLWAWLLPGRLVRALQQVDYLPLWLVLLGLVVLVGMGGVLGMRIARQKASQAVTAPQAVECILGLNLLAYLAFMLVSMSLFDAATTFENRILAPVFVLLLIGIAVLCLLLWQKLGWFRLAGAFLAVFYLGFFTINQVRWVESTRYDSEGFASRLWRDSPTLAFIRSLPDEAVLYTNEPTLVYIRTDRPVHVFPTPVDTALALARPGYADELARVNRVVADGDAWMVFLGSEWQEQPYGDAWHQALTQGIPLFATFRDGEIYAVQP